MPSHFKQRSYWLFIALLFVAVLAISLLSSNAVQALDTDSDGYSDGIESFHATDPNDATSHPVALYEGVELYLTADQADKDAGNLKDLADGNDFTLTGGDIGDGLFSEGVEFPGGGVMLQGGDVLNPGTDSYTVSLWFKVDAVEDLQVLACKGNRGSGNDGWMMFVYDGQLRLRGNHGLDGEDRLTVAKAGVVAGQWHHAVLVIDQVNGKWIGYLDGVSSDDPDGGWTVDDGRTNAFTPGVSFDNTNSLTVGTREDGNFPLKGMIDDVVIARRGWAADYVGHVYVSALQGYAFGQINDTDGDALPDVWEMAQFGDLSQTGSSDFDGDGLSNYWEYSNLVDPTNADVDADGFADGLEVMAGSDLLNATDVPAPIFSQLASYHPFDADTVTGTVSYDLVGGYHAALQGENLTSTAGILGNSIKMINNGGDERADFGDVLNSGITSHTISFWFNPSTVGSSVQYIATKGNGGSNVDGWSFWLNHDGLLVRGNHGVDGNSKLTLRHDGVEAGKWYHVALIINQETGKWEASLNGSHSSQETSQWYVPAGRTDSFTPGVDFDTESPLLVGLRAGYSYEFKGQVDDFFIARRAFDVVELANIHTAGRLGLDFSEMADSDGDAMPDAYETLCAGGDLDPDGDLDGDGISNKDEFLLGSRADLVDSDGDTISDSIELQHGTRLWDASNHPDPLTLGGTSGYLTREVWRGISGGTVESLTLSTKFLQTADDVELTINGAGFEDSGSGYGSRMRGTIKAPATGNYTFYVSGNNNVDLWLSGNEKKFGKTRIAWVQDFDWVFARYTNLQEWDKYLTQRSRAVWLEEGQHYHLEVLHKKSNGGGHAWVAWQVNGGPLEPIPPTALSSLSPDVDDVDDDYLPDSWETVKGLDPTDNGSNDSREGEFGDYDGDTLTNRDEYLLGTDPTNADSDGDGADDYTEINIYGSNPLAADVSAPILVQNTALGGHVQTVGDWYPNEDGSVYARERRGSISYSLTVQSSGVYMLEILGRAIGNIEPIEELPIVLDIDGIHLGKFKLRSENGGQGKVTTLTQWLTAGTHTVTVLHDNAWSKRKLQLDAVHLLQPGGIDADGDGMADWLGLKLLAQNGVSVCPPESLVSPVCVEGVVRHFDQLAIISNGQPVEAYEGIENGWYTDIELNAEAATTVDLSFEGGAVTDQKTVAWKEFDIMKELDVTLRKGSSLRLTGREDWGKKFALNSLDVTVIVNNGESSYEFKGDTSVVHKFDTAGVHQVYCEVRHDAKRIVERTVTVTVIDAEFGAEFPVYFHRPRDWHVPQVGPGVYVESDPRVGFLELDPPLEGGRLFRVDTFAAEKRHLLARTELGGPIVARGVVQGYGIASTIDTGDTQTIHTYSNGDKVVRMSIVAPEFPPGGYIRLTITIAGITFADGTTVKIITEDDMRSDGIIYVDFNVPTGIVFNVCHRLYLHDAEGNLIGAR